MATGGGPRTRPPVPRASILAQPFEDVEMTALGRFRACDGIPWASLLPQLDEQVEVTTTGRTLTGADVIEQVALCTHPIEHDRLPSHGRAGADPFIQRWAVGHDTCDYFQVAPGRGGNRARPIVPGAALIAQPLKERQVALMRGLGARLGAPRTAVLSSPPDHVDGVGPCPRAHIVVDGG